MHRIAVNGGTYRARQERPYAEKRTRPAVHVFVPHIFSERSAAAFPARSARIFRAKRRYRIAMNDPSRSGQALGFLAGDPYARATCDLLDRLHGLVARRIGYVEAAGRSTVALLACRYPDAKFEALEKPNPSPPTPADTGDAFDLIVLDGDIELLPSLDHLLPMLMSRLRSRGILGLHAPNNLYEPNRALARLVAADGPWAETLVGVAKTRPFNATIEGLHTLLRPICGSVDIWETTYLLALKGVEAIVDFMRPTSLAPFLKALDPLARNLFLGRYLSELQQVYPTQPDGAVLVRFPMILAAAAKP
jgi:hypothetical protein